MNEKNTQDTIEVPSIERPTFLDSLILGAQIQWLRDYSSSQVERDTLISVLDEISENTRKFSGEKIALKIEETIENLEKAYEEGEKVPESEVSSIAEEIRVRQRRILNLVNDEKAIPVKRGGLFDVEAAMDKPEMLFLHEVWEWMPEETQSDIAEACKSLAAGCPTGAMMLSLRALEERLRKWYESEYDEEINDTWGQVLKELEEEFGDGRPKPAVLSNLDYLREKRNEIFHPEESASFHESITMLYMVRGTITEIHNELEN